MSRNLYGSYGLRRVYYSAFSPIPDASTALPPSPAPLLREHRLYQADWLMRFYGFDAEEIATGADGNLDLAIDPKTGLGAGASRALPGRRQPRPARGAAARARPRREVGGPHHRRPAATAGSALDDLARLGVPLRRAAPFVIAADHTPGALLDSAAARRAACARRRRPTCSPDARHRPRRPDGLGGLARRRPRPRAGGRAAGGGRLVGPGE